MDERLMTSQEVARFLQVSTTFLKEHKEIPRFKLGKSVRFEKADVMKYLENNRTGIKER